jgi:hypothetical protein
MLPNILKPGGFIVNTQTRTLPGEHWIAVYVSVYEIKVFDPLGSYYPALLINHLEKLNRSINYNKVRFQELGTQTCGQYCLLWLTLQTL